MRNNGFLPTAILCAVLLTACGKSGEHTGTVPDNVTSVSVLSYDEREAGTDIYPVRVLVSKAFVRLDDGYAGSDYVLLDRQTKTVFSVSHEERSILVIENRKNNTPLPADLVLTETRAADAGAPVIAGQQPVQVSYLANGELCYQAVMVSAVMAAAVAGMAEYAVVLGERQLNHMDSVPESMRTPCFMSRYVYAPARQYRDGLPVQEWDSSGYFRTLTDFNEDAAVPAVLFELPAEYERFSPGF